MRPIRPETNEAIRRLLTNELYHVVMAELQAQVHKAMDTAVRCQDQNTNTWKSGYAVGIAETLALLTKPAS